MSKTMLANYLRTHRLRCGLSQRELGVLVGYRNDRAVSHHERSKTIPPLLIALAYQEVFQVPVAELFAGFNASAARSVQEALRELRREMSAARKEASKANLQKLEWLNGKMDRSA